MIKCLMCVAIGIVVGMGMYALGVPDPIPPIIAGVVASVMVSEVRHE